MNRRSLTPVAAVYVVAAFVAAPLAVGWAVSHTRVDEQVGITPTTFTLGTDGHSEVRLGIAGTVYVPRSCGTGLVTGYQLFDFHIDGSAVVEPRVDVGDPTGLAGLADGRYPDDRETTGG